MSNSPISDNAMPYSEEAEKGVLSCFLQEPVALLDHAADNVSMESFYHPIHRLLYGTFLDFRANGNPIDLVTVSNYLLDNQLMDKAGGPSFIAELLSYVPTPAHYPYYCGILKEKLWQRSVLDVCGRVSQSVYDPEEQVVDMLRKGVNDLFEVLQARQGFEKRFVPIKEVVPEVIEEIEQAIKNMGHTTHGIATGFTDFDRRTMGLRKQQHIVIAGRPAMGKTSFGMNIAENIATANGHYKEFRQAPLRVGVVTMEMTRKELTSRMILGRAHVNLRKSQTGMLGREDQRNITSAAKDLQQSPILFLDTGKLSIQELTILVKRAVVQHQLDVVIIDYLQLLKSDSKKAQSNRQVEVGEVSQGLKALAKEANILVISLAQVGRSAEDRPGCVPQLADLRESGDIEQDADMVLLLYREAYYANRKKKKDDEEEPLSDDTARLIIAKGRDTGTDDCNLTWDGPFTRFGSTTNRLYSNNDENREH